MNDIYYFILSYALLLAMFFGLVNFLSNGFFLTFIRVKISRGRKVLVECHGLQDIYYKAGEIDGKLLKFVSRGKKNKIACVDKKNIFRKIGVFALIYDDVKDRILDIEWKDEAGGDTETFDHITNRIAMAPQVEDKTTKIIIGLLVFILIGILFIGFIVFDLANKMGGGNVI